MGDITTATGAKFFFGPQVPTSVDTVGEFSALQYTEVGLVETLGEFGDKANAVNFAALSDGRTRKSKGTKDAGEVVVTCALDQTDPGQQAMIAAEATNLKFAVKVVLPDQLTVNGTGTTLYFRVLVMSKGINVGGSDNVIRRTFNSGIDSAVLEVPPT